MALTALLQGQGDNDGCTAPLPKSGAVFEGVVFKVRDGDSICLGSRPEPRRLIEVRLSDVYSPERGEPGANEARAILRRLVLGERLRCVASHKSYDRIVARCDLEGVSVGRWMEVAGAPVGGRGR